MLPHYLVKYLCPRSAKLEKWVKWIVMHDVNCYARFSITKQLRTGLLVDHRPTELSPGLGLWSFMPHNNSHHPPSYLSLSNQPLTVIFFACVRVMTITGERLKINVIGEGKGLGLARMVTWSVCPRSSDSIKGSLMLYHTAQDAAYAAHVVWAVCLSVGYRA